MTLRANDKDRIRGHLLRLQQVLEAKLAELRQGLSSPPDCLPDLYDLAWEQEMREDLAAAQTRCIERLQGVRRALAALDGGRFGYCDCGEPIATARLMANPLASTCIECAAEAERRARTASGRTQGAGVAAFAPYD